MGIKSTYTITRAVALQVLAWYRLDGTYLNDEDLAVKLEDFEESYFRNYVIVDKVEDNDRCIDCLGSFLNFV